MRRRHPHLTPRQDDVARLAAGGLSNREIAEELDTGEASVRKHLKALNQLFGTHNRTAMAAAWRQGVSPD
jgi:DNA-binding CsgD family transcriptional regulator